MTNKNIEFKKSIKELTQLIADKLSRKDFEIIANYIVELKEHLDKEHNEEKKKFLEELKRMHVHQWSVEGGKYIEEQLKLLNK